jgi:hypothetical protein
LVQRPKYYAAITQDELTSKWTKELSLAIIKTLDQCAWSYFFPIQIGLRNKAERIQSDQPIPEFSAVLIAAVKEDSLQWEKAIAIALECRDILRSFHISDLEVEIREGRYIYLVASKKSNHKSTAKLGMTGRMRPLHPCCRRLVIPLGILKTNREREPSDYV